MSKNDNKLKLYISTLTSYKKKLIPIIFFEIFYTFKFGDNFYKIHDNETQTDSLPCPYYFLNEISKFVNKNHISKVVDLGSGTGRVVNFLATFTQAKITGYEVDEEVMQYARKKKRKNAIFVKLSINSLNFSKLDSDCYIFNVPLRKEKDIKNLIKKIELGRKKHNKKYFLIVINIDSHLVKIKLSDIFNNFNMIKLIQAGKTKTLRIFESKI